VTFHATLWNGATATDLGTLSGGTSSSANAINDVGQIEGYSWTTDAATDPNSTTRAILWNGTTITDLNSLLDPVAVSEGWTVVRQLVSMTKGGLWEMQQNPDRELPFC
jgi:probable HAF family extracellular repeat protein